MMRRLSVNILVTFSMLVVMLALLGPEGSARARSAKFYYDRGVEEGKKGQPDRAIAYFTKALEINPRDAKAYYNRGVAYGKKGQRDQEIADYSKALKLNPRFVEAYNNRAVTYYSKKDYDKAWKDVRKAQSFGFKVNPGFLKALRQASGRDK